MRYQLEHGLFILLTKHMTFCVVSFFVLNKQIILFSLVHGSPPNTWYINYHNMVLFHVGYAV